MVIVRLKIAKEREVIFLWSFLTKKKLNIKVKWMCTAWREREREKKTVFLNSGLKIHVKCLFFISIQFYIVFNSTMAQCIYVFNFPLNLNNKI